MQNGILEAISVASVSERSVDRALGARRAAYRDEVARLVQASFELIRESGSLEPRVGAIVRAAGLSNQAFYRHFRSKDELLLAVLDEGSRLLTDYLRHRMESAGEPVERVNRWLRGILEQALNPEAAAATRPFALSRARLSELFPAEVAAAEARTTALVRDALEQARRDGALPDGDAERDADALYTLAIGWLERALARSETPSRADAEHVVAFALRALGEADRGA